MARPVYSHGIEKLNDTAEPTALIRNAFTAQHDQNCIVVLAGPATNLVKVLDLPGVKDVISKKVRFLSLMGGCLSSRRAGVQYQNRHSRCTEAFCGVANADRGFRIRGG